MCTGKVGEERGIGMEKGGKTGDYERNRGHEAERVTCSYSLR